MGATRANLSVPGASACGIPASRLLSVLDHDRAYIYSGACTVYRAPSTLATYVRELPDPNDAPRSPGVGRLTLASAPSSTTPMPTAQPRIVFHVPCGF